MQTGIMHARLIVRTLCLLPLPLVASCVVGPGAPSATGTVSPYPPPNAAVARPAEAFRVTRARQHGIAPLFLPGSPNQQLVKYAIVDGQAVMEGDILLGPAATLPLRYGLPWAQARNVKSAVAVSNRSSLWPRSEIPFVIDGGLSAETIRAINGAVAHINTTSLKVRPRSEGEADFVVFRDTGSGCSSFLGHVGGQQEIQIGQECGQGSIVHEILHAAGFFHEQSRGDRDEFITIVVGEIAPGFEDQFEKRDGRGQDIGAYDFGSIMHYSSRAFSRSGRPTIVPKVAGVTFGQREALSPLDRAAIEELYGSGGGTPPAVPPPPSPGPNPNPLPPAPTGSGSFAGNYSSNRGNVACTQSGTTVNCQYPGGLLICAANGATLDCGWSGGGQGRATFQRQPNGSMTGTFGDFFSAESRGPWNLVPASANPRPSAPSAPPAAPSSASTSLAGGYVTTRGPMTCSDSGTAVACAFQETPTSSARLDCVKSQDGLALACTWLTFLPPGSGRASFTRRSAAERTFTGTWGNFGADTGGGAWELKGR